MRRRRGGHAAGVVDALRPVRHHLPLVPRAGWTMRLGMRRGMRCVAVVALWLVLGAAWAQRVEGDRPQAEGPYQVEVTVQSQVEAQRRVGFTRALMQVL